MCQIKQKRVFVLPAQAFLLTYLRGEIKARKQNQTATNCCVANLRMHRMSKMRYRSDLTIITSLWRAFRTGCA
jgi:hypothetical protein